MNCDMRALCGVKFDTAFQDSSLKHISVIPHVSMATLTLLNPVISTLKPYLTVLARSNTIHKYFVLLDGY